MNNRYKKGILCSTLTTMQIGGEVDYFSTPNTLEELQEDLLFASELGLRVKVMGGGSNIVFSSNGFRGLLIRPNMNTHTVDGRVLDTPLPEDRNERYATGKGGANYLQLVDTAHGTGEYGEITFGAGVVWGAAVVASLQAGLLGLHTFAHIPCRVGGAVVNNIHGGGYLLSQYVVSVRVIHLDTGEVRNMPKDELCFGYDHSIFLENRNIIVLSVTLRLERASDEQIDLARAQYLDWVSKKKAVQPTQPNCGSVFQNLAIDEVPEGKSQAAGYYLERVGARGRSYGNLQVSPTHANFIMNLGGATSTEFVDFVRQLRQEVLESFSLTLRPEVEIFSEMGEVLQW